LADNRLIAVCLYGGCDNGMPADPPHRKTIARYSYNGGWYLQEDGTEEFFKRHDHGLMNCIVFVPEICEAEHASNDDVVNAERVAALLHGKVEF
jgi:hypothetical protein